MPERQEAAEGQEEKMYLNHAHGRQNWIIADVYIIQECMNDIILLCRIL